MNAFRSNSNALTALVSLALLAGCAERQNAISVAPSSVTSNVGHHATSSGYCPALPGGTGILPDGDFSQALDPGDMFNEPHKGTIFAPDWAVMKRTIDFNGSTFWNIGGYCSVDLDGNNAGGILTGAFSTQKGTSYTVSFLLSGNGGE